MPDCENLLVVIGASAGGLKPIKDIMGALPESFQGTVIVATHRDPTHSENLLASILGSSAHMLVRDPVEGERLFCQTVYVGPPSKSLTVQGNRVHYDRIEEDIPRLERIDNLFEAAARHAGPNAVGVILSGMLWDGVEGLRAIQSSGGRCFVQSPMEAKHDSMPITAIQHVDVDLIGSADEIAAALVSIADGRNCRE